MYETMKFLATYSFIYETPNIDIFISDVLEKIPHEWAETLVNLPLDKLRKLPFEYYEENWPKSLLEFLFNAHKLYRLRFQYESQRNDLVDHIEIPDFIKRKTPVKKLKQISNMALQIKELALIHNCRNIIDMGSGLGYLDQVIHHNFGFTTVGFECDPNKTLSAMKRVSSGPCSQKMHHVNQKIENTSLCKNSIENTIKQLQTNKDVCSCNQLNVLSNEEKMKNNFMMVGLHSCGPLMHSMMDLFLQIPEITVFLSASCCYHKIDPASFPISDIGKNVKSQVKQENPNWDIFTTGLRLGCQTTRNYWINQTEEDFAYRENCLAYRAIMQSFLKRENLNWKKPKRHLMKKPIGSFEEFVLQSLNYVSLNHLTRENCIEKLNNLFKSKSHLFPYIRILSLLQTLLQPIWETLIIKDRIAYFHESGIETNIFVLCEEDITPRNLLICGVK